MRYFRWWTMTFFTYRRFGGRWIRKFHLGMAKENTEESWVLLQRQIIRILRCPWSFSNRKLSVWKKCLMCWGATGVASVTTNNCVSGYQRNLDHHSWTMAPANGYKVGLLLVIHGVITPCNWHYTWYTCITGVIYHLCKWSYNPARSMEFPGSLNRW